MNFKLLVLLTIFGCVLTQAKIHPKHIKSQYLRPKTDIHVRIAGGNESVPHSHPYQVALITETIFGTVFCGGSLITKNVVLTSAQCLDEATGPTEVILGAHNITEEENSQIHVVAHKTILHENWNYEELSYNIGLVILQKEIELNENIQIIPLPENDDNLYEFVDALVTGWGQFTNSSLAFSSVLREVTVPVMDNQECSLFYHDFIKETDICTRSNEEKSACQGDFGGPLVYDGVQIGIVSFGPAECENLKPIVYTRVSSYLNWIKDHTS